MSHGHCRQNRLALLDCAFDMLKNADFTLMLHLREPPPLESLCLGANSAVRMFPVSGSRIIKRRWVCGAKPFTFHGESSPESFVNESFDLRIEPPVKQMLITDRGPDVCLVTRFHHAAADGLSAALWLGHQLSVAYGFFRPHTGPAPELQLRRVTNSVRRSTFAFNGASDPLWTTNYIPSGARRWFTINFPATELQRGCRRARGFTYSDLLATCALEVLAQWNAKHDSRPKQKIGLWVPMNVRAQFASGFGNGTSRIRLYARSLPDASLAEKAREVRKQVSWSTAHGEWAVPEVPFFTRLPSSLVAPLLNGYLKQPTVDMSTAVFSHVDRWVGDAAPAFKYVTRMECVGLLHSRQHLAMNAATHQQQTWLTFTYDPALLDADDVCELARMYWQQIDLAREELT